MLCAVLCILGEHFEGNAEFYWKMRTVSTGAKLADCSGKLDYWSCVLNFYCLRVWCYGAVFLMNPTKCTW